MFETEPIITTTESGGLEVIADANTMYELVGAIQNDDFARDYRVGMEFVTYHQLVRVYFLNKNSIMAEMGIVDGGVQDGLHQLLLIPNNGEGSKAEILKIKARIEQIVKEPKSPSVILTSPTSQQNHASF